jgi:hypothetical protein
VRQTLISIAVLTALSLPGLASAEVGPFNTENRVGQPHQKGYYTKVEWVKNPQSPRGTGAGVVSPRDPASGLPTGRR